MRKFLLGLALLLGGIGGAHAQTVNTRPYGVTSTVTNGTLTTAGTFQSILAASTARNGCLIFNNNASDYILVFFGANGSATTSNSIKLLPGQFISCISGGVVLQDNVSATGQNNSDTYIVVSQ